MKRKQRKKKSNAAAENEEKPKRTVPYSSSSSTSLGVKRTEPQFKSSSSFLDKMRAKLSGGHFRMLNEKLYTCTGKEALQYFREDPELFNVFRCAFNVVSKWNIITEKYILKYKRIPHLMLCGHSMFVVFHEGDMLYYWTVGTRIKATELRPQIFVLLALAYLHDTCAFDYMEIIANMFLSHILMPNVQYHTGYQEQMSHWPEQPVNIIIKWLKDRSSSLIVADFGCGDARLAKNVKNKVFSFDLVANDPSVIACDMSKTFLDSSSIDVSVFCLSLMGIDYPSYLQEAHRVLKPCGWLLVAEVKSRYDPNNGGADPDAFIKAVNELGFTLSTKDFSNKMFILLYFKKKEKQNSTKKHIEWPELKPCLYKRR